MPSCYNTIIKVGWYHSSVVNFFRIGSANNAKFMRFDVKF